MLNIHSEKIIDATEAHTIKKEIWRLPNFCLMDRLSFPKQKSTGRYQRTTPPWSGCRFLRLHRLQISWIWETCCVLDMAPVAAPQGNVPVLHSFIPARAPKAAQRTKGYAWRTTAQRNMGSSLAHVLPDRAEVGRARSSSQDSARRARGLAASPPSIWDSQELG